MIDQVLLWDVSTWLGSIIQGRQVKGKKPLMPSRPIRTKVAFMPSRSLVPRPTRLQDSAKALPQPERSKIGSENSLSYTTPLWRIAQATVLFFLSGALHAQSTFAFKKEPLSTVHWFPYLLVLAILLVALLALAKKSKGLIKNNGKNQIIEKIPINQKTQVYVLDYQGQRFLIADNQNALAIHPLHEEKPSL